MMLLASMLYRLATTKRNYNTRARIHDRNPPTTATTKRNYNVSKITGHKNINYVLQQQKETTTVDANADMFKVRFKQQQKETTTPWVPSSYGKVVAWLGNNKKKLQRRSAGSSP